MKLALFCRTVRGYAAERGSESIALAVACVEAWHFEAPEKQAMALATLAETLRDDASDLFANARMNLAALATAAPQLAHASRLAARADEEAAALARRVQL